MEYAERDIVPVEWKEEYVKVLDQTLLPAEEKDLEIRSGTQSNVSVSEGLRRLESPRHMVSALR